MAGADAQHPAKRGRQPHRAAGVAAQREIDQAGGGGGDRAGGGAPRHPVGRGAVQGGPIMGVDPHQAVGDFIGVGFADQPTAGVEQGGHRRRRGRRRRRRGGLVGAATAGNVTGHIEEILGAEGEPTQDAVGGAIQGEHVDKGIGRVAHREISRLRAPGDPRPPGLWLSMSHPLREATRHLLLAVGRARVSRAAAPEAGRRHDSPGEAHDRIGDR